MTTLLEHLYRFRLTYFAAIIFVSLVGLPTLGLLRSEADYRIYFSETNQQLLQQNETEELFGNSDNLLLGVRADTTVFGESGLGALLALTEDAWKLPFATRVDSVTNFQHIESHNDDVIVSDLVNEARALTGSELERIRKVANSEPSLLGTLVSADGRVGIVDVSLTTTAGRDSEVFVAGAKLIEKVRKAFPENEYFISGSATLNHNFSTVSGADAARLFPAMVLVVLVCFTALAVLFRARATTVVKFNVYLLLVILVSVLLSLESAAILGIPINAVSVQAPLIVVVLAVVDCIHMAVVHLQSQHGRAVATIGRLLKPLFVTSFTTMVGFLSLNFSESPPFHDFGNFIALGIFCALAVSMAFGFVFLGPNDTLPNGDTRLVLNRWLKRLAETGARPNTKLLWTTGIVTAALAMGIPLLKTNDSSASYLDKGVEYRDAYDLMTDHGLATESISFTMPILSGKEALDPAYLEGVVEFQKWLQSQSGVVTSYSIVDTLLNLNQVLQNDLQLGLPSSRDSVSHLLLLYEMSLPYGMNPDQLITSQRSHIRVVAPTSGLRRAEVIRLNDSASQWIQDNLSTHVEPRVGTGFSIMAAHIGMLNLRSMITGNVVSVLVIALTIAIGLRSVSMGSFSILTNFFPSVIAFGLWGYVVGEVNLAFATVFAITLGIVVDDTVHLLHVYKDKISKTDHAAAWRCAIFATAPALATTTMTLGLGFLALLFGSFSVIYTMGAVAGIVVLIALLFDVLVLPHILALMNRSSAS